MTLGLAPPEVDHRRDPFGLLLGTVVDLGRVVGDVVQLPHVVVERRSEAVRSVAGRPERLERHGFPALVVDRS